MWNEEAPAPGGQGLPGPGLDLAACAELKTHPGLPSERSVGLTCTRHAGSWLRVLWEEQCPRKIHFHPETQM